MGEVVYLETPRFANEFNFITGDRNDILSKTFKKGEIQGMERDYRGEQVLVVSQEIPELDLSLAVKIDENEAFETLAILKRSTIAIYLVVLAITIFACYYLVSEIYQDHCPTCDVPKPKKKGTKKAKKTAKAKKTKKKAKKKKSKK